MVPYGGYKISSILDYLPPIGEIKSPSESYFAELNEVVESINIPDPGFVAFKNSFLLIYQTVNNGSILYTNIAPYFGVDAGPARTIDNKVVGRDEVQGSLIWFESLFVFSLIPAGSSLQAEAGAGRAGANNFFNGAKYSPKVLRQMNNADDLFHGFPISADGYATKYGLWSTKVGADGKTYQWLKMKGSYGNKTGTFEFIKDANGVINHRFLNVH